MAGAGAHLAAVLGTGQTKYVAKRKDVSMNGLVRESIDRALADSGSTFDDIDAVIPPEERAAFMAGYKAAAGFANDQLNKAPPTIAPGARVRAPGPTR